MRVTSNSSTPSAFVIELYLGAQKAVRVFPEWQLPSLHSQGFFLFSSRFRVKGLVSGFVYRV